MSLIRQIWLLLLATLLTAFVGSFAVWMWSSKGYLETQLRLKNADNAQSLALNLSQYRGDMSSIDLALAAMFDTGFYQRITFKDAAGRVVFNHVAPERLAMPDRTPPAWFAEWIPVASVPGLAQVSDGWRALGSVEVVSHAGFAHSQLWQGALKTGGLLAGLGVLACVVAAWGVGRIRRPLDATVEQAQALMERRFVTVPESSVPELARLGRAMNAMVERLRTLFDEQSTQVEQIRQQAHCDPLTGLSHRRHFMAQLHAMLAAEEGRGSGLLVLVRVEDLAGINRLLGHRATDALLQRIARVLQDVTSGVPSVAIGRLNGGDFGVCLTRSDEPLPTPANIAEALRRAFTEQAMTASVVVGGVGWERGMSVPQLLAAADSALAAAESRGPFSVEVARAPAPTELILGEDEWRRRLALAVAERRVQLMSYPVVDRQMLLLHHECPMRLQLDAEGPYEPAANWLPMALRTGLVAQIDALAVEMTLEQIALDHMPRGVNVAPASLLDSGFLPRLRAQLAAQSDAARFLWLEVHESAAVERFELVRELCKQLRPFGVRVGLEHAGERLARIERLPEAGLDYVKLDASVVRGVGQDAQRAAFVTATANMLHSLGLSVYGEGVTETVDTFALRQCGLDGVTGPAVRLGP